MTPLDEAKRCTGRITSILQKRSQTHDKEEEKCYILSLKGRSELIIHVH